MSSPRLDLSGFFLEVLHCDVKPKLQILISSKLAFSEESAVLWPEWTMIPRRLLMKTNFIRFKTRSFHQPN